MEAKLLAFGRQPLVVHLHADGGQEGGTIDRRGGGSGGCGG